MDCPQCGLESPTFREGVCSYCFRENQRTLDEFNARYDYWKRLTDKQRDQQIKAAQNPLWF